MKKKYHFRFKNIFKKLLIIYFFFLGNFLFTILKAEETTFSYTGAEQTFDVPTGTTSITVDGYGGMGGHGASDLNSRGGLGGRVQTTISVTPGTTLYIYVGGAGGDTTVNPGTGYEASFNPYSAGNGQGGFNGGTQGGQTSAGAGAGATDVRFGGNALSNRIYVSGGGGGGGNQRRNSQPGGDGGHGGGTTGGAGSKGGAGGTNQSSSDLTRGPNASGGGAGGGGGTSSSGGSGGSVSGADGALGVGGQGGNTGRHGGGGGGGYYGGGGGGHKNGSDAGGGGGGGSSFCDATYCSSTTYTQGYTSATGNGSLVFTYTVVTRSGYTIRITSSSMKDILSVLEQINTDSKNATLTSALDDLTDTQLKKAARQIKGMTIQKSLGQSVRSNNSFKRAMTSAVRGPSFSQLVQNNFANLNQNDIQSFYNPGVERVNLTNDFTISDIAKVYSKRNLLQIGAPDNSFYLRTFGGVTEQDKVGDDIGYDSNTAGFVFGNQTNIDNLQAGWGLGVSTTGLDYDEGFGLNNTHSLHGNFFANKEYKHLDTNLNLGSFLSKNNSTRNITEGSIQTLKSSTYDLGFDLTGGISKKINLKGWVINPSINVNTSYVIQDDIDESGGDLALKIKTDNLLQIKPELGFNLDREFSNNGLVSRGFNFSLFGSEEKKLDGADTTATIKDTGDGYALIDDKKTDRFITTGLGYSSQNSKNNSQFLINAFATQNQHNDMNSSLVSLSYMKKF